MHSPEEMRRVVRRLRQIGGSDIVVIDGDIYEIAARKLDRETVRKAVNSLLEEKRHDPQ